MKQLILGIVVVAMLALMALSGYHQGKVCRELRENDYESYQVSCYRD